ncbi:MAG: helix-turn-helix domain-containing protein [Pirellulaceae bacterium]
MSPAIAATAFSRSGRSISQSLGFQPELRSDHAGWNRLGLFGWYGCCQRAEFERFAEPVIVHYMAGVPSVGIRAGRAGIQYTHPGLTTIIPPGTEVCWEINGNIRSRTIHLDSRFLSGADENDDAQMGSLPMLPAVPDSFVAALVRSLDTYLRDQSQMGSLFADYAADTLALHLLATYAGRRRFSPRRHRLSGPVLNRCIQMLHEGLGTGVSLQMLAAEANLSRSHFCDAFKKSTGNPPHQFLTKIRLERGRELLITTALPTSEIALRCGFSSQSHFTTAFRKHFGKPPRRFRAES